MSLPAPLRSWKSWASVLTLLVLGSIPFFGFLFSDRMLYGSDQIGGFGNFVQYAKSIHAGTIPGWHPWYLSGMPTLDAIAGDLPYPPFWVAVLVLPIHKVLGYMLWSHVILAGLAAYILLRRSFELERWSATALAAAYMLNMNILSIIHGGHTAKVYIQAWLPLGIHFLIQSLSAKPRWWQPLGLAVTTALMVSTSHLQMSYYALIAYFLYLCWRLWESRGEGMVVLGKRFATFWCAILLGIGLALPVLYPPMKYTKEFSVRNTAEKTGWEHATSWSLHPEEAASMLFPEFVGMNETYWGRNPFKLNSEYAGVAITAMGIAAIVALRTPQTWFWATIAILALLNGLAGHTPFYRLLYGFDIGGVHIGVPGVRNFRAASMIMFLFAMAMAVLSALWIKAIAQSESWKAPKRDLLERRLWIAAASVGGGFLLVALMPGAVQSFWTSLFTDPTWPESNLTAWLQNPEVVSQFRTGAMRTAILGGIVLSLSAMRVAGRVTTTGLSVGVLLVTMVDLLPIAPRFIKTFHHSEMYSPEPVVTALQADSATTWRALELPGAVNSGFLMLYGIESAGGSADNELAHYQEFRSKDFSRVLAGLAQMQDGTVQGSRTLDLLNVKYLLYRSDRNGPVGAALNRSVLPRIRLVGSAIALPLESQLTAILDTSFDHRNSLLIDPAEAAKDPIASALVGKAVDTSLASEVTWLRPDPDHWEIEVKTSAPGILALAEPWYPNWKASVDGKDVEILRVNYALRGIPVGAGAHKVSMRFESPWVALGVKAALLCAALLAGWALVWAFLERRSGRVAKA